MGSLTLLPPLARGDEKTHHLKESILLCPEKPRGRWSKKKREKGGTEESSTENSHTLTHIGPLLGAGTAVVLYLWYLMKSQPRAQPHQVGITAILTVLHKIEAQKG